MAKARCRSRFVGELTRTALENAIWEANLGYEDEEIAGMYYVEQLPMVEIAEEMGMDRKTVSARLRRIEARLRRMLGQ